MSALDKFVPDRQTLAFLGLLSEPKRITRKLFVYIVVFRLDQAENKRTINKRLGDNTQGFVCSEDTEAGQ